MDELDGLSGIGVWGCLEMSNIPIFFWIMRPPNIKHTAYNLGHLGHNSHDIIKNIVQTVYLQNFYP